MHRSSRPGALAAAVSLALATSASAASQDLYNNTTTYLNNFVLNLGATDVGGSNLKTLMVADDLTLAPGSAGKPVDGFSFSVRNNNGVSVQARPLVTIYADNGANAPGALLASFSFVQAARPASSTQVFDFYPLGGNIFTIPASGKIWAGMAFDNRNGMSGATAAQLDQFGQGGYGPITLGSSTGNLFVTNAAGNYAVNNPVGHLENVGLNLGWKFTTAIPGNVTWNVAGGGAWNFSDNNWTGGSPDPNKYVNWDSVTFNKPEGGTITLLQGIPITPTKTTVSAASGTYTFAGPAGAAIATGTLDKSGFGRLVITNTNTFTGDTTVYNSGSVGANGSGAHLTLNSPSGNALSGDLHIGVADAAFTGVAKVSLAASNQIADNRVVHFDSPTGRFAYLSIRGNTETVAGIASGPSGTGGAIENGNLNGAINTSGLLTLAPPAATTYTYTGIIRDADSGGGTGKLNLSVDGAGTQVLGSGGAYVYTGTTSVNAGTLRLQTNLTTSSVVNLTGGTLELATGGGSNRVIKTPSLSIIASAKLDLKDNKLIVAGAATPGVRIGGGTYTGLSGLIQAGRNGGAWNGPGILTSLPAALTDLTTLAIATAEQTGHAGGTFAGVSVAATDVLVMYTYAGDANLDGTINPDDYANISFNDPNPAAFGYYNGDFNYDGDINADDFALIDFNFNAQTTPFPTSAGLTAVPEPAGVAVVGVVAATAMFNVRRQRRRSHAASDTLLR